MWNRVVKSERTGLTIDEEMRLFELYKAIGDAIYEILVRREGEFTTEQHRALWAEIESLWPARDRHYEEAKRTRVTEDVRWFNEEFRPEHGFVGGGQTNEG